MTHLCHTIRRQQPTDWATFQPIAGYQLILVADFRFRARYELIWVATFFASAQEPENARNNAARCNPMR